MYADVFESWKYMFLRRSLAQYKNIYIFCQYISGVLPPNTTKLATLRIYSHRYVDSDYINFKTFAFLTVYYSKKSILHNAKPCIYGTLAYINFCMFTVTVPGRYKTQLYTTALC